ncbi:MAG: hypothetical protein HYV46_06155 [candidate division NC10 bacterium]|nr:hypothetical protein [candidate division NC10 bacterium]
MDPVEVKSRLGKCAARLIAVRLSLVQAACAPGTTVDGLLETIGAACDEIDAVVKAIVDTSA